jgi:GNAT superfamily N-acetyltransferase
MHRRRPFPPDAPLGACSVPSVKVAGEVAELSALRHTATVPGPNRVRHLEDLFVEPDHIGSGVGRALWEHAIDAARALGFARITLEADPGAEPFYLAMGGRRCGSVPSGSIPDRRLPLLEFSIARALKC